MTQMQPSDKDNPSDLFSDTGQSGTRRLWTRRELCYWEADSPFLPGSFMACQTC